MTIADHDSLLHPARPRLIHRGAQGVIFWHRRVNGRIFTFTLVFAGWWGVGPTGQLTIRTCSPGLEAYPEYARVIHTFQVDAPAALRRMGLESYLR